VGDIISVPPGEIVGIRICEQYMHLIANRRCAQLALASVFSNADNPFPGMSQAIDLKKEKKQRWKRRAWIDGHWDGLPGKASTAIRRGSL